ncbi:response regulator transcription factor [Brevibacterium sp. 50QC2O2]|uniref:response regulator n=1 Tax=Brevibacterium TaxID=1696 RepID=UPI00211C1094|nr:MULTISPECIES: response regulator transcription factor [unclassified Brevibacterium]MCQ9384303.1 response regulator transcription factor [Brevibacterium sp. 68QC2CO]MCQ9388922.1 response regulator transcription factor [Brevibacterium sp. 50QC2O2]
MTVRVMLVDDQEMIRMGMRMVLESQPGIEIVGEADDGDTALDLLGRVEADVVLMDVRMPRMSGVEATRRLRERPDAPGVLILTTFDLDEYAYDGLRAGASGFLLKDTPVEEVTAAIHHVHAGDAVVAPSTTRRLLDHFTRSRPDRPESHETGVRLDKLTPREHEVLRLVARGLSNAEIAAELVLAEGTVKVHVGRILTKLGLRDRVQAVVLAYETGLVEAGER